MQHNWFVLLPPLIVLVLGFTTRRVIFSLCTGIIAAALIATKFAPLQAITLALERLWSNTELANVRSIQAFAGSDNLFIYIFLFILGIIVTLLSHSGGSYAYGNAVSKQLTTARSAECSSLFLSMCLFVDDYFNSLTVGSVMHPLTDKFKIPRVKLAFLVDSMAAPLAMVIPVSSWVAVLVGFVRENGVSNTPDATTVIFGNPFSVYLHILPFVFYSFIIFFAAWFIVVRRISFGSMHRHEQIAHETGNLFGGKVALRQQIQDVHARNRTTSSLIDFVFPVSVLIVCVIGGLLFSGDFFLFGGAHGFLQALQHADASLTLFIGGVSTTILCSIFFIVRRKLAINEVPTVYWQGIRLMWPSIVILLLAWTFGNILKEDLQTGQYLAHILIGQVPVSLLPAMFFLASAVISFSIGSSWGTMAIMFPIAIPMVISFLNVSTPAVLSDVSLILPVLGAILSGGVLGDHISPISDTTVMSSTSTGSHHIDHVQTQMAYALPIAVATGIAFLVAGHLNVMRDIRSAWIPIAIGVALSAIGLEVLNAIRIVLSRKK